MLESELKSVINDVVNKIVSQFKIEITKKDSDAMITKFYQMGHDEVELQFNLNITQDSKELAFLKEYTFNLIKNFSDDMKDTLKEELSRGLLNNESIPQLLKRVSKTLDISKERAKMIVRTETNRTFNVARQTAAEKSGLKLKKKWVSALDDRTSKICQHLNGKVININQKFEYKGEYFDTPPAHPNCFLKDTLITTKKRKKYIQDIKVGDEVLTHKNRYKEVYHTMVNSSDNYYKIEVGTGKNKRVLRVTGDHPVMTQRGWVLVKNITLDDYLVKLE